MRPQILIWRLQLFLAMFASPLLFYAADPDEKGHWTEGSTSLDRDDNSTNYKCVYRNIRGFNQRPADGVLNSITVEWQKPELDRLGTVCTVSGHLFFRDAKSGEKRPANWFQGIAVYLANSPKLKPDWSAGFDDDGTEMKCGVIEATGQFRFKFWVDDMEKDRAVSERFQIGLALATLSEIEDDEQTIEWKSSTAAVAGSVTEITVPAAQTLPKELELIHAVRGWADFDPNGVAMIRAVNALQCLGKEKALATLEEYLEISSKVQGPFNEDFIFWIIRVLFEPINLSEQIPFPGILVHLDQRELAKDAQWPLSPMVIIGDIPFMVGHGFGGSTGIPERPRSHILWARRHGVLRDAPLNPTTDPRAAVDALLKSHRFKHLGENDRSHAEKSLQFQATAMVGETTGSSNSARRAWKRWQEFESNNKSPESDTKVFRWDAMKERFVELPH
jgi:hypothetical protein